MSVLVNIKTLKYLSSAIGHFHQSNEMFLTVSFYFRYVLFILQHIFSRICDSLLIKFKVVKVFYLIINFIVTILQSLGPDWVGLSQGVTEH